MSQYVITFDSANVARTSGNTLTVLTLLEETVTLPLLFSLSGVRAVYAVIASGGKQYRVAPGDVVRVEKLSAEEGSNVEFNNVLMVNDGEHVNVGAPFIEGSSVTGVVKSQGRGKKIQVLKFHRRKQYKKLMGHRQAYTEVEITAIRG